MTSPKRLLIIADVGDDQTRHLGDEAMLEANLAASRRLIPGVSFTVVSHNPAWAAKRYGVDAIALLGFPRDPFGVADRRVMLDRVLTEAARSASGGGILSSTWSHLLFERVALLRLACIFEKPAVVLGQTLGPQLGGEEL